VLPWQSLTTSAVELFQFLWDESNVSSRTKSASQ
jgi:hypothetical protein